MVWHVFVGFMTHHHPIMTGHVRHLIMGVLHLQFSLQIARLRYGFKPERKSCDQP